MRAAGRISSFVLPIVILTLSGCALDPDYNFDDSTLFKGHQAWETKRHADDWIVPLGDGISVLGATFLVQTAQNAVDDAPDRAVEPRRDDKTTRGAGDLPESRYLGPGQKEKPSTRP